VFIAIPDQTLDTASSLADEENGVRDRAGVLLHADCRRRRAADCLPAPNKDEPRSRRAQSVRRLLFSAGL
jgi:hypothetical protein